MCSPSSLLSIRLRYNLTKQHLSYLATLIESLKSTIIKSELRSYSTSESTTEKSLIALPFPTFHFFLIPCPIECTHNDKCLLITLISNNLTKQYQPISCLIIIWKLPLTRTTAIPLLFYLQANRCLSGHRSSYVPCLLSIANNGDTVHSSIPVGTSQSTLCRRIHQPTPTDPHSVR